ncbi:MAG: thioredoxin domain-containing protein [Sediminibacterium sp.]
MKNRFFCMLSAAIFFLACNSNAQNVDANTFEQKINAGGVQVLDVRTAGEYSGSHLKNVMLADWTDKAQFAERTKYLDKNKTLLVYCAAGGRSGQAAEWLKEQGFKEVVNLQGGITAWNAAGKPVVREGGAVELSTTAFNATISSNNLVLVDVGAAWCPPCKKMEPVLEALAKELQGKYTLLKVDGGNDATVMKEIGAAVLPTYMVYKNGKLSWKKEGIVSLQELKEALTK